MTRSATADHGQWKTEFLAIVRAASGGLLFGVPLLYTMEVWWVGERSNSSQMLAILMVLGGVLVVLNLTAGFRTSRDMQLGDAAADTIRALAIGIVVTAAVLIMLREVTIHTPLASALGKVVYESVPFCLGIGVARFLLSGDPGMSDEDDDTDPSPAEPPVNRLNASVADVGATVLGAAFVGLSIAPTDEIPMVTAAMDPPWLVTVLIASVLTSYAIVFVAGFARQDRRHEQVGIFQSPITETVVTSLVSLIVAALLLWLFQRDVSPSSALLDRVVVLGFPVTIGGAVGRLAL